MYRVNATKQYRKSFKRLLRSGNFDRESLDTLVGYIASGITLHSKHQDHWLNGPMVGYRECHVKNDLLLVYQIIENEQKLILIDIGSHSELFG